MGKCSWTTQVVVILSKIIFTFLLLFPFDLNAKEYKWLLEYVGKTTLASDSRFRNLCEQIVPSDWIDEVFERFTGPQEAPKLVDDRYFVASACRFQSCQEKVLFLFDTQINKGLFALAYSADKPSPIYILSNQIQENELTPKLYEELNIWINKFNIIKGKIEFYSDTKPSSSNKLPEKIISNCPCDRSDNDDSLNISTPFDKRGNDSLWVFAFHCRGIKDSIYELAFNPINNIYYERYTTVDNEKNKYKKVDQIDSLSGMIKNEIRKSFEMKFPVVMKEIQLANSQNDKKRISDLLLKLHKFKSSYYYPVDNINLTYYNDIAFYLDKYGYPNESISILNDVIKFAPDRVVAYINLGDAYYDLHNNSKAKEAYSKYIELMKKEGKENKIPPRVLERVK